MSGLVSIRLLARQPPAASKTKIRERESRRGVDQEEERRKAPSCTNLANHLPVYIQLVTNSPYFPFHEIGEKKLGLLPLLPKKQMSPLCPPAVTTIPLLDLRCRWATTPTATGLDAKKDGLDAEKPYRVAQQGVHEQHRLEVPQVVQRLPDADELDGYPQVADDADHETPSRGSIQFGHHQSRDSHLGGRRGRRKTQRGAVVVKSRTRGGGWQRATPHGRAKGAKKDAVRCRCGQVADKGGHGSGLHRRINQRVP